MTDKPSPAYLRRLTLPRRRLKWVAMAAFLGWAVISLVLAERGLIDLWELEGQEMELQAEMAVLRAQADQIDWELQEPGGMAMERPAREKFEMQRPGEIVYHFAPATPRSSADVNHQSDETPAPK